MNDLAKAHLLAAQLLAHNLESNTIDDIKAGLNLLSLHRAIPSLAERHYKRWGKSHLAARSKHPGWVACVSGGIDCDGVRMDNHVDIVNADMTSIIQAIDDLYADAEGPVWYRLEKPSVALALKATSTDLVMAAHEDGHPHSYTY